MSPLKVLTRGYAMARKDDGTVLRSVRQVAAGDALRLSLADGSISAVVTHIEEGAL